MDVSETLEKYGLSRDTATKYIDAITRMNQTQVAEEIGVTRQTINRYKKAFNNMSDEERAQLIVSLSTDKLLENTAAGKRNRGLSTQKMAHRMGQEES